MQVLLLILSRHLSVRLAASTCAFWFEMLIADLAELDASDEGGPTDTKSHQRNINESIDFLIVT